MMNRGAIWAGGPMNNRVAVWTGGHMRNRGAVLTGGISAIGQEGFDEVLASTHIWTIGTRTLRRLIPLIGMISSLLNGISTRGAPDLIVLIAGEEARNGYTDDCTEKETTDA